MQVGDLVRYNEDGDIGIILGVDVDFDFIASIGLMGKKISI